MESTIQAATIGHKLKTFRKLKHFSQLELELEIGASLGLISRIENGKLMPKRETVMKIAEVLKLTTQEIDYLIGPLAAPATPAEVAHAINIIKPYFAKKGVIAYMVDDRSRLIEISDDFLKLAGINQSLKQKFLSRYIPELIMDSTLGISQFLDVDKLEQITYQTLKRTYAETYFMIGDPCFEELLNCINRFPLTRRIWRQLEREGPTAIFPAETRDIFFNFHNHKVKMTYSVERLMGNQKFMVLQYQPTNLIHKLLLKFS